MNSFKYPKGSEWRKWDLHLHTKGDSNYTFSSENTILSREQDDNKYPRVFIEHIYSINDLGAIAITNHNGANWIDKIIKDGKNYATQNSRQEITIFSGVEVESSDGIHLLVIFNPKTQLKEVKTNYRKSTWKETIEHFLTKIGTTQGSNASKTTEEIMETAKKWDALCIFAHVTSDKGFFRISSGSTKKRIYKHRLTSIFQIPTNGILGNGQKNIIDGKDTNYCDEQKSSKSVVCITASDAKKLSDIGTNDCWIKADPTFEGLKQIIYEPEERVYIGEEPPKKLERSKIIKSITINNPNKWFEDNKVLLNEELISIIGGKGTGKTAILDLIAYTTRSYKCYEQDETKSKSFLKKALKEIQKTKIKIEWDDGDSDEIEIKEKLEEFEEKDYKVKYLPQDFVDQLCSEIGKKELEEQIENVIFQKIPEENKIIYTNFKSYKDVQLKIINDKKSRIVGQIKDINSKIEEKRNIIATREEKSEERKKNEEEIKKLERIRKEFFKSKDIQSQQKTLDKIKKLEEEKASLEKEISTLNERLLRIDEIKNRTSVFLEDAEKFVSEIRNELENLLISQNKLNKLKVILYPKNIKKILDAIKNTIERKIKIKKDKLTKFSDKINKLNKNLKLEESKQKKIQEINKLLLELKSKLSSLEEDLKRIKEAEKYLPNLIIQRENIFINSFELIFEEKEKLKKIYSVLESIIKGSKEENEKLFEFTIQFDFNAKTMVEEGDELIDHAKDGLFFRKDKDALNDELEKIKFTIDLESEKISEIGKKNIKEFLNKVNKLFFKDGKTTISQLKSKYKEQDFDNWLYSPKYYTIEYSIKFNGIDLKNLSPGLKGIALLILYLELDKEDTRPILIDQPEENLDNRSVYRTLMRYFREVKKRRQVIMVTHNPNLVVNADSEQVFVANFDKGLKEQNARIRYVRGSLENTFKDDSVNTILEKQGIREHVCEILEGGKDAFEKREKKYGF